MQLSVGFEIRKKNNKITKKHYLSPVVCNDSSDAAGGSTSKGKFGSTSLNVETQNLVVSVT